SSFKFEGKTWGLTGYVNYPLMRGRQHNAVLRFAVSSISAKTLRSDDTQSEDKMRVYDATYNFDLSESYLGSAKNVGSVKLSSGKLFRGEVGRNSRLQADQTFTKLNYSFNRSQRLSTEPTTVLNFKLNGQFTQDKLVGVQQLGIGGPSSVRGYPTGTFLADKGAYAAADLYWYASDDFNPFVFVDYASASVVEGESFTNNNVHLGSYGIGANWTFGGAIFDFTLAKAIGSDGDFAELISNGGKDAVGRKSTQLFISMKYNF
ncbi:MAG: ShlB/FhaC/HecB family hemolysin secretion/activation protein, partial [Algicola sp.]|nr:ShlB/FhaC/HecB family hemolysin secretion/activation protein [Algicola sp.]